MLFRSDSYLYMQGTGKSLKYDNANTRFEFNDDLNVTGQVDATAIVIDSQAALDTNTGTVASTSTITVTQTTRNVMKVVVYIVDNVTSDVHTVEALALRNGATAMLTTYGEMYSTAALATFSADISGGALRLRATPASSNSTTFSSVRTSLT